MITINRTMPILLAQRSTSPTLPCNQLDAFLNSQPNFWMVKDKINNIIEGVANGNDPAKAAHELLKIKDKKFLIKYLTLSINNAKYENKKINNPIKSGCFTHQDEGDEQPLSPSQIKAVNIKYIEVETAILKALNAQGRPVRQPTNKPSNGQQAPIKKRDTRFTDYQNVFPNGFISKVPAITFSNTAS
jgi:hypothetical protein